MKSRPAFILLLLVSSLASVAPAAASESVGLEGHAPADGAVYLKLAEEAEEMLRRDVLCVWFPRTVDGERGGFHANFTRDWKRAPGDGKFSVFQGRMTWVAAQVALRRPDLREQFLPYARHGLVYLNDVMWDRQAGGFYWGLDDAGRVTPPAPTTGTTPT